MGAAGGEEERSREVKGDEGRDGGRPVGAGAGGEVGRRAAAGDAREDEGLRPGGRLRALGRSLARGPGAPRPGHRGEAAMRSGSSCAGPKDLVFSWNSRGRSVLPLELSVRLLF